MNFIFIFIYLISLTIQKDSNLLIENLFKNFEKINKKYCKQYNNNSFHYKIPKNIINIKSIINYKQAKELNNYKYIYISDVDYLEKITLFQKSTIFFIPNSIIKNSSSLYNKDYCIIKLDNKFEKYKPFIFTSIKDDYLSLENFFLLFGIIIIFYIISIPVTLVVNFKSCSLDSNEEIFVSVLSRSLVTLNNIHPFIFIITSFTLIPYIFYCFYKAYFFISLIFLVNGYQILNNESIWRFSYGKTIFFFGLFESIISFVFFYFIPFNRYYLFTIKNWIYHIFLLILAIKSIKERLVPLYRQLRLEQSLKTFLAIGYKAKLIIYIKIIVFSIIYSLIFIIIPFFQIKYINKKTGAFHNNFFITISCEIILSFILSFLFFPSKITKFFYLYFICDNNREFFFTIINTTNKKINKISNLSKKDLKLKYSKYKIPIVLIKPFNINNKSYNNLFIGKIEDLN